MPSISETYWPEEVELHEGVYFSYNATTKDYDECWWDENQQSYVAHTSEYENTVGGDQMEADAANLGSQNKG